MDLQDQIKYLPPAAKSFFRNYLILSLMPMHPTPSHFLLKNAGGYADEESFVWLLQIIFCYVALLLSLVIIMYPTLEFLFSICCVALLYFCFLFTWPHPPSPSPMEKERCFFTFPYFKASISSSIQFRTDKVAPNLSSSAAAETGGRISYFRHHFIQI